MQQDAVTEPSSDRLKRHGELIGQLLKRGGVSRSPEPRPLRGTVIALIQLAVSCVTKRRLRCGLGDYSSGQTGYALPSLSEEGKRCPAFLAPLEPGLKYLLRLLTYRCSHTSQAGENGFMSWTTRC